MYKKNATKKQKMTTYKKTNKELSHKLADMLTVNNG